MKNSLRGERFHNAEERILIRALEMRKVCRVFLSMTTMKSKLMETIIRIGVFLLLVALIAAVSHSLAIGDASKAQGDNPAQAFAAPQTQDPAVGQVEGMSEGSTIIYRYEDVGRLREVEYDNGTVMTYTYDAVGNRKRVSTGVYAAPDVNMDTSINMLDVISVGNHWGETGPPGWIREDVNDDGDINMLDVIMIGNHWGE
jgi:YD repeat-containing protein